MLSYQQIRDGILSASDDTARLAIHLDQLAQKIGESPADYAQFLTDAAGDDAQADPGAAALLQRATRANALLLEGLKTLRTAIVKAQAAAKSNEAKP